MSLSVGRNEPLRKCGGTIASMARTYTVTYRATDSAGNYADAIATVTVRSK